MHTVLLHSGWRLLYVLRAHIPAKNFESRNVPVSRVYSQKRWVASSLTSRVSQLLVKRSDDKRVISCFIWLPYVLLDKLVHGKEKLLLSIGSLFKTSLQK